MDQQEKTIEPNACVWVTATIIFFVVILPIIWQKSLASLFVSCARIAAKTQVTYTQYCAWTHRV